LLLSDANHGAGTDTVHGGHGKDYVALDFEGLGAETVYGGDGADSVGGSVLLGGGGKDSLNNMNGLAGDSANGGPNTDTCRTDDGDTVTNCEVNEQRHL
jgi:hypothetical protein